VSVARLIADQRTFYAVPHAFCCAVLGVSESWFYKWFQPPLTPRQKRRAELDAKVAQLVAASGRTYGSPRISADLLEAGWRISVNTVADSMRRQGLAGRRPKRGKGLTRQDRMASKFPDLLKGDFTAGGPNVKWCGDMTEIATAEEKLYLATVLDLFSRRLLACPTSDHPNAELAADAIKIAAASRGGRVAIEGVIFHTDRGSTYTEGEFHPSMQGQTRYPPVDGPSRFVFRLPPRSRSSRHWNTRFCPDTTSPPRPRRGPSYWTGATTSTTTDDGTAAQRYSLPLSLRRSPLTTGSGPRSPPRFEGKLGGRKSRQRATDEAQIAEWGWSSYSGCCASSLRVMRPKAIRFRQASMNCGRSSSGTALIGPSSSIERPWTPAHAVAPA